MLATKSPRLLSIPELNTSHVLKQRLWRTQCHGTGFKCGATCFNFRDVLPCNIKIVTIGKGNSSGAEAMAGARTFGNFGM
jgi:hypothetical protein